MNKITHIHIIINSLQIVKIFLFISTIGTAHEVSIKREWASRKNDVNELSSKRFYKSE